MPIRPFLDKTNKGLFEFSVEHEMDMTSYQKHDSFDSKHLKLLVP